jgi:hypothetical protein
MYGLFPGVLRQLPQHFAQNHILSENLGTDGDRLCNYRAYP